MKEKLLVIALAVSTGANLYLAWRLRQACPRVASSEQLAQLQQVIMRIAKAGRQKPQLPQGRQARLALRLDDCAACFDFLNLFATLCQNLEERCQVLLLHGTPSQAQELALRYQLAMQVTPAERLPEPLAGVKTPVVWLAQGEEILFFQQVLPTPEKQLHTLLQLQAAGWW